VAKHVFSLVGLILSETFRQFAHFEIALFPVEVQSLRSFERPRMEIDFFGKEFKIRPDSFGNIIPVQFT
jgi:hypothetical protein